MRVGRRIYWAAVVVGLGGMVAVGAAGADRQRGGRRGRRPRYKVVTRMEKHVYKTTPQGDLAMLVHFPKDWKATDRRAAIVFFFGGGWRAGNIEQFTPQADYLATRGMVAARADYRVRSRHGTGPDKCVEDAKSAVRWLRANAAKLGVDPGRVVASGGSAGAHIALCTAVVEALDAPGEDARISSRPNLLVLFNPVVDCLDPAALGFFGSEELARKVSPAQHLRKGLAPAILFYGTNDRLGTPAKPFARRSAELGNDVSLYLADGQPHGFFNLPPWYERTLYLADRFLARHGCLKGEPTVQLPEGKVALERYVPADEPASAPAHPPAGD